MPPPPVSSPPDAGAKSFSEPEEEEEEDGREGIVIYDFSCEFLPTIICHLRRIIFVVFSGYRTFQPVTDMFSEKVKWTLVIQNAEFHQKNIYFSVKKYCAG